MLKASVFLVVFMRLTCAAVWGEIIFSQVRRKRKTSLEQAAKDSCAGNAVASCVVVIEINSEKVAQCIELMIRQIFEKFLAHTVCAYIWHVGLDYVITGK